MSKVLQSSLAKSDPARPPVEILKARERVPAAERLAVSVVIAYEDRRAHVEHVLTWTQGQTHPEEEYEVIVVTDGTQPAAEKEIAKHLRPHDVLVRSRKTERFVLCNVGAEVARSARLFFTEDHCLAEPGAVALAARVLDDENAQCATVGWGNINGGYVGKFEEQVTTGNMAVWQAPDHWNLLRARGFVITRRAFREAGGFPAGYGLFAEPLLAARLHEQGIKTAYTPEVGVKHVNSETLADLAGNAWNYSHFECEAAMRCEAVFFDRYFNLAEVLLSHRLPPCEARAVMDLAWRELRREWRPKGRSRRLGRVLDWARIQLKAVYARHGGYFSELMALARVLRGGLQCQVWRYNETRRYRAFAESWRAVVQFARVQFLAGRHSGRAFPGNLAGTYEGGFLARLQGWGLHPAEMTEGRIVRWTTEVALVPFCLAAGDYEITLDSAGLRGGETRFPFVLYWDRHRLSRKGLQHDAAGRVTFKVTARGGNRVEWLRIFVPRPLQGGGDPRVLGFPLVGVTVKALPWDPDNPPSGVWDMRGPEFQPLAPV